jgi:hypothetical protein
MAKSCMDRSYFHALRILWNQPKKTIIWSILLFFDDIIMILSSVLGPSDPTRLNGSCDDGRTCGCFFLSVTETVLIWLEVIAKNDKMSGII